MKKPAKVDEQMLRKVIDAMPPEAAKAAREGCKKNGLLPGGGPDKPKK
jgi:hypothetical protein